MTYIFPIYMLKLYRKGDKYENIKKFINQEIK